MLEPNNRLRDLLIKHEGLRLKPYLDTVGKLTIGVGRNLDDVGISKLVAMMMLSEDIERCTKEAASFDWFKSLNATRQDVVICMIFNLGLSRFNGFKKMIEAVSNQNYEKASKEMLDSKWAKQVGGRANELAQMMLTGRSV